MKKTLFITYGLLIVLTASTALISNTMSVSGFAIVLIMGLSVLKFLLVSFEFMELKKANSFWKVSLISVLGLIVLGLIL
ncbi:cytochrome C oxidase subunit IV family protein [Flavobacterium sinopsychrotolerans]|uniref:Cytochrome C oxidase subunit IV n=1 Tax=Flavobacterium sinopsychrotolerans TaxID=604089 RepID=A0A1H8HZV2_9FLAO|nr:cytochrome C oxidase subunit IV family protein [Flavobacterium sinopsychrotolerans]SEN61534.1 Cytochrome C oxidase subunit IV [Flavobacterium sinopsychrotolerans]